jgi:protein-tyrosine phosphatase
MSDGEADAMPGQNGDERRIQLAGQDNFRDLGGYEAEDGRRVRWRQVFRSGELCELSDADVERLAGLGIRTVVDLRGRAEAERKGPDRLPPGASLISIAIEPGDLSPHLGPAFATGDLSKVPEDLLIRINRDYVRSWGHQLAALLRVAADPGKRPLVFHCTQGKDRAGISAAVLLSALGVPWQTVLADYLLSNLHRREQAEAGLLSIRRSAARQRGVSPDQVDVANIRGLFFVHSSYLAAAHEEITACYGSIDDFIRDGVGWPDSALRRLRDELLE